MKILFLTLYPEFLPSSRFRVHQFIGYLKKNGIDCEIQSAISAQVYRRCYGSRKVLNKIYFQASELLKRLGSILSSSSYDLIFLQKGLLSISLKGMDELLFMFNNNVVFDFDDAVYLSPPQSMPELFSFLEEKKQVLNIIKRSRAVIAGNKYLSEAVSGYNDKIFILPTSIDTDFFYPKNNSKKNGVFNILWSGNRSGNYHLKDLSKPISTLARKYKIRFTIQSDSSDFIDFSDFQPAETIFKPWSIETELINFQNADVGIMNLHDTPWERGKCAFKALLYMSVGVPVVASPIGVISEIIKEGESGYFANSESEWIKKISILIEDAQSRIGIGLKGRKIVEEHFSLKVNAPKLKVILDEAIGR